MPGPGGRWWSGRHAERFGLTVGRAILEVLPVSVALQVLASYTSDSPANTLLPFWLLLLLILGAAWISHALRRRAAGGAVVAALPVLLLAEVVGLAVSPLAYGTVPGEPFSVFGALGSDLMQGATRLNDVFWMTALAGYIWWRGLRIGRNAPTLEGALTLFKYSFGVVVAAVIGAVLARGFASVELAGRLAVLLPLEVFVGLVTLSLARAVAQPVGANVAASAPGDDRPWVSLSLLLAGAVVGVALILSLILSFNTLQAALLSLGPVGAAIYTGLTWLIFGLSYVLFFIFAGPISLIRSVKGKPQQPYQPPQQPKTSCSTPDCLPALPPAQGIAVAIFLGLLLIAILALAAYFVYRTLRALRGQSRPDDVWEAREALDGDPLRDLFARFRRRGVRRAAEEAPASAVRQVYREVLAAAAAVGLDRLPAETPDEYEERLRDALTSPLTPAPSSTGRGGAGADRADSSLRHGERSEDVAELTAAYDRARYGEVEVTGAKERQVRAQGEAIIRRLRSRQPGRGRT